MATSTLTIRRPWVGGSRFLSFRVQSHDSVLVRGTSGRPSALRDVTNVHEVVVSCGVSDDWGIILAVADV
jgi:hypothetical protein